MATKKQYRHQVEAPPKKRRKMITFLKCSSANCNHENENVLDSDHIICSICGKGFHNIEDEHNVTCWQEAGGCCNQCIHCKVRPCRDEWVRYCKECIDTGLVCCNACGGLLMEHPIEEGQDEEDEEDEEDEVDEEEPIFTCPSCCAPFHNVKYCRPTTVNDCCGIGL